MNKSFATFFQETGFGADQKVRQHFFGHFEPPPVIWATVSILTPLTLNYISIFEFYPQIHLETRYSGARTLKYFFE